MSSCFNCETPISTEDRFCGNCGIALKSTGGAADAGAHEGAPSSNDADLLDAGASSASGADASQGDYSAELQPTIVESSQGGGGSATAAARAHEPVASTPDDEHSSSQNLSEPSASQNFADESSQNLSEQNSAEASASQGFADSSASSRNLSDASSSLSDSTAEPMSDAGSGQDANSRQPTGSQTGGVQSGALESHALSEPGAVSQPVASSPFSGEPSQRHTSDEDRRRTGDLPSRGPAYVGRTGGSRRSSSQLEPGTLLYGRYEIVKL